MTLGMWESVNNYHSKRCLHPKDWIFNHGLVIYFNTTSSHHYERVEELVREIEETIEGSYDLKSPIISGEDKAYVRFSREKDALPFKLKYKTEPYNVKSSIFRKMWRRG